ncbi:MAG: HAD family hydrolase [Candidatus Hermodarchaeota archaeon]|nr:HAD family hydrolase [Candidatus Hermodarchaeota archaeon]
MNISAFVSDLDGTLLDTRERSIHAHVRAFQHIGRDVDAEQVRLYFYNSFDVKELLLRLNIELDEFEFDDYIEGFRKAFFGNWKFSQVIPGVFEALELLQDHTGYMRLITSRHAIESTRREVRYFGLDKFFDSIFTLGDLAKSENQKRVPLFPYLPQRRRLIRFALQGIEPNGSVWVLGDAPGELEAAKSLGFTTIGVLTGHGTKDSLMPFADYILDSAAEIVQLI